MSFDREQFEKDLNVGSIGERVVREWLENRKSTRQVVDVRQDKRSQQEDIDFLVENYKRQFYKVEVKTDRVAHKSGRIPYEVTSRGADGCAKRSKADYFAFYLLETKQIYLIDAEKWRNFIKHKNIKPENMGENATGCFTYIDDLIKEKIIVAKFP